jgi:hypothetical protein
MEAEVNSPMAKLGPGEAYTFDTHWFPCRLGLDFHTAVDAGVVGDPLQAVRQGDQIELTGRFGVFYPGHLEARLYSREGVQPRVIDLQSVSPRDLIELRQTVPGSGVVRVSVHLIDQQNIDRGALGEVMLAGDDGGL